MFQYAYDWILYDILGFESVTIQAFMIEPFALILTYAFMILVIAVLIYLLKWVFSYLSGFMP